MQTPFISPAETDTKKIVDIERWLLQQFATGVVRETLTASRTYFVRSNGSNANDGRSTSTAFSTWQKAVDAVSQLDRSIYDVTIDIQEAATFNESVTLKDSPGANTILIQGIGATTILNNPSGAYAIGKDGGATKWRLTGFKITQSGTGYGVYAINGALVQVDGRIAGFEYGAHDGGFAHNFARNQGIIELAPPYTISGGGFGHLNCVGGAKVGLNAPGLVTLSGTPAFAGHFALSQDGGSHINANGYAFSGSATGSRFFVDGNGVIAANSGDLNLFPGSVAGTIGARGGQYI